MSGGAIYIANTASKTAAPMDPIAIPFLDPAPVKGTGDVLDGLLVTVAFETPTEANVVAAGTPVVTPAACEAAVVAGTRAAEALLAPATVENCT